MRIGFLGLGKMGTPTALRLLAASRQTRLCLAGTLAEVFAQARATGPGQEDWVVDMYHVSQRRNEKRL